ncbi:MAG: ROK family protein [Stenotrophomonas maltophilia]
MPPPEQVAVAMDWGGTWARASVIDRQGRLLWSSRRGHTSDRARGAIIQNATELLQQGIDWARDKSIAGIGVAVAGPVDAETGTLYDPPNLPTLNGVSLKALWEPELGYPVHIGNDATLAALGEFHFGAGKQARDLGNPPATLVYVTVSTGIGGGVVYRGNLFLGAYGLAGEVGHQVIDTGPQAPACQCGSSGCLEALASGTAIARIARDRLVQEGRDGFLVESRDPVSITPASLTSETVFQAAAQGDSLAISILDDVASALAVGLVNLLHLYNPDLIVLGGGVTNGLVKLDLVEQVRDRMLARAMSRRHRDVTLVTSTLGDAVGMIGAASLVWQEVQS